MGDRYTLTVKCKCGFVDDEAYYAPTSGFMTWKCPKCGKITNLEEYSGIDADDCASTEYGARFVQEQRKRMKK